MRRTKPSIIALCGVLAALALALMFLGGTVSLAAIACPVIASFVMIPVYSECGLKWSLIWYIAVAALSALLTPQKEAAILFVFFGYYPMLRKYIGRLRGKALRRLVKTAYLNAALAAAYGLMYFVFRLGSVVADFQEVGKFLLLAGLLLANISFLIYDVLIGRLEILYHLRLRPKLHL
ncbi:MAG: hypothetical protein LBM28_05420 [Oscillospiraceae bacterium]|nr:hypothetical protein [Oscillospiraceae bacterium]